MYVLCEITILGILFKSIEYLPFETLVLINLNIMQDVAAKIMSFSQQGPRVVCILSANGAVSTVTLRQPSTSGGTVTYEVCQFFGCFDHLLIQLR